MTSPETTEPDVRPCCGPVGFPRHDRARVDAARRRAVIQPIVSNRDVQRALDPLGLAYATGHCPQVKASGYLLGGGLAWNPTVWGCGAESVEAIEPVTAAGERITASAAENPDVFRAARGAGSGFFGIATRYHLRLHPLPAAFHGRTGYYRLDDAPAIGDGLGKAVSRIAPSVELSQFLVQAPPALREAAADRDGWLCMVTGTALEDTPEPARAVLAPLARAPVARLMTLAAAPTDFEGLLTPRAPCGRRARARGSRRRPPTTAPARGPDAGDPAAGAERPLDHDGDPVHHLLRARRAGAAEGHGVLDPGAGLWRPVDDVVGRRGRLPPAPTGTGR